ncbi:hypothetical protein N7462_003650 [Penicillium macrosclerotiorum]|uniref:uncharacterized protein n=1 Tax=Penicillium macrosclerotiorum TaxID=303699 RepID=UPI00254705B8|nr:uncharacterized protein N7462_003650 [Penicillium macrosclerotiorum]KAJ5689258.1 hypothetical protein N7462_003650 [Penicillium macrosclerotiorum]
MLPPEKTLNGADHFDSGLRNSGQEPDNNVPNAITASIDPNQPLSEQAQLPLDEGTTPNTFDLELLGQFSAVNANVSSSMAAAVAEFLDSIYPLPAVDTTQYSLQGYLVQQQVISGVPGDQIRAMRTSRPPQVNFARDGKMSYAPRELCQWIVTPAGIMMNNLRQACYRGKLAELPVDIWLPVPPSWSNNGSNEIRALDSHPPNTPPSALSPFTSVHERQSFINFYVEHFATPAYLANLNGLQDQHGAGHDTAASGLFNRQGSPDSTDDTDDTDVTDEMDEDEN